MESDNHYEIENRNWYPRFSNPETEKAFILDLNANALNTGRIAVFIILILWNGFALFDLRMGGEASTRALIFRLLVISPIFAAVLALLYSRYAVKIYQSLSCFSLFVINASIYYVVRFYDFKTVSLSFGYNLPLENADGKAIFIFVWLLIIFMASSTVGFTVRQSVLNGIIFLFFSMLAIFTHQPSAIIVIILAPFSVATLAIVLISTIHIQYYARERYRATKLLSKYLPRQLTHSISDWQIDSVWKYSRRKLTLFFSDIKDFTRITDAMEPEDMAALLNEYLTWMTRIINKYNGTLAQVIGDGLYVFFGAPEKSNDTDNAVRCVKMAIEMQLKMRALNAKWFDKGVEEQLTIRCGINTGMATVGGYGSSERKEYTAMGMQVNIAARLEQACLPNNILISHTTWALVKDRISCVSMDPITVKGYHRPILIYQVDIQDQTRISQHDSVEKAF